MKNKYALFTCDTEFTPPWNSGSWKSQDPWTFEVGIEVITNILSKHQIRGTFFCVATLVEQYPKKVKALSLNHLVGCHSYNHENYGGRPVKVWTDSQPILIKDDEEKRRLLIKAKKIIRNVIGKEPEVFVAPFDCIDTQLLKILENLNFKVDCSYHNYSLGLQTHFFQPIGFNILELPLSVVYCGNKLTYKNVLEAFTFDKKNLQAILQQDIIMITCHPYEYTNITIPHPQEVLIVGEKKKKALEDLIVLLKNNNYEFIDILQLKDRVLL